MNNILSAEEAKETLTEVWKDVRRMSVDCVEREDSNTWNQNWPSAGVGEHSVKINRNYSHFVKAFLVATSRTVLQPGRIDKTQIFTKYFRACWVPSVFSPL